MRNVQVSGRIANFGKTYRAAEGDKSAFCVCFINMPLDRKDESTGYTASTPVKVTANGYWADRLNAFGVNETIYITGKLDKENDWTNGEGELIKGGLYVRIEMIDNWAANSEATETSPQPTKPATKIPTKPGKPGTPNRPQRPARPTATA